jgi:hypothetical protein
VTRLAYRGGVGGHRPSGTQWRRWSGAAVVAVLSIGAACGGSDEPAAGDVGHAAALTALVEWQAGEQEPVLDDAGEPQLPVIYVAAAEGETIDVGVQAEVASATVEVANVRFADEATEAFDEDIEGQPVIDGGAMLLVGPMPEPAPSVVVDLLRYLSAGESEAFVVEIAAETGSTPAGATVTSVTQP